MPAPCIRAPRPRPGLALAAALLLAGACVSAGAAAPVPASPAHATRPSPAPPAAPPPPASPGVVRATLANGLEVVVVPDRLSPVATVEIGYRVGSADAPPGFPGMAHAVEHMMFRGSPGLTGDQLMDVVARLGGHMNAYTEEVATHYHLTVPAADLPLVLRIGAIRMSGMTGAADQWAAARGAIDQEVAADRSDPTYRFDAAFQAALLAGTPYAHGPVGTRASFARTTAKRVRAFHDAWYAPNDAVLVVSGDVDPKTVLAEVRRLYGPLARRPVPARPPSHLAPVAPSHFALDSDQGYGVVGVGFRLPGDRSPDLAAAEVLADVLGSHRGPLYALVGRGQALDADFAFSDYPPASTGYAYAVVPRGTDPAVAMGRLREALARAVKRGFSEDLVDGAKRQEITEAQLKRNSIFGLADTWSRALVDEGRHRPEDDLRAIEAVTAADVDRVARRDLDLAHAVEGVLRPRAAGAAAAAPAGGGSDGEHFAPTRVKGAALPPWAARALARLPVPAPTLTPTVTVLPNGLKVIVQPTAVSDTVSVYGRVKAAPALESPPGRAGIDLVLGQVLDSGGTTTLDRVAFHKALEDIGALEHAGADFRVQALAPHFDRAVALLADHLLHPALTASALARARAGIAGYVGGLVASPDYRAWRARQAALVPPGDPTLRRPTPKTVGAITLADLRAYDHAVFRPDLTTLVVIGKVSPARALAVVRRHFGAWRATGKAPVTDLPPVPPNRPSRALVPDPSRGQDQVVLAETVGLTRLDPGYDALDLGNAIFGGGLDVSRLYEDLRAHGGLVYYVWSHFELTRTRGVYAVQFGCDPDKVAEVKAVITRDLKQMIRTPPTAVELDRAKSVRLREAALDALSVDAIASGYLRRSVLGLPLDEPTVAARRYLALDARAVQRAMARWLDPTRFVEVVQGPAPR